jgi:hypothetical protein
MAFLSRDKYVPSTQLNRPFLNKMGILTFENPDWRTVFLYKTNAVITGKECARLSTC